MVLWTQVVSIALTVVSAICAMQAAKTPMPSKIRHIDHGFFAEEAKPVDDLDRLVAGVNRQGQWSIAAAVMAAASALLQVSVIAKF